MSRSSVRGADLVVEALIAGGVRQVFTLSGNQILAVYDATVGRGITLIHTRHEAAAVHMADGWGRLTEEPGVALVTAGPGHLNAVSALYTALMSQSPVVLLSGHAPRGLLGRGAFQEVDQVGAARPVVKAAWVAERAEALGDDVARALSLARAWPPGPVHVSLPGDLLEPRVTAAAPVAARSTGATPVAERLVSETLDLLAGARRPLMVAGPAMGRSERWTALMRLAEITGIPALLMESPRGVNDPALRAAGAALGQADVVLLLGKALDYTLRFGQPPAFAAQCRFVHVDLGATAPAERVALALPGEPLTVVGQLIEAAARRPWQRSAWAKEVEEMRRARPPEWDALARASTRPMHPLRLCAALQPLVERGVLVADGGEFGQWCQAALEPAVRLINGPAGSIGSAVPMALGACLARPDLPVFTVLGDGTFGFHALEFDTAVRHRLPIVAIVGNDARWNAEHQLQLQHYGAERAVGCELLPTRYDRVVEALGGHGEHVEHPAELGPALARAVASERPACVNVVIDGAAAPAFARGATH
ncbi:MAG TPA: thiamine pyrophosphate-binding protein [Methylomirabilota bacterium]|nr:thiamine pyrophosphate-binding protein [Methylomirabilota bacterium]